MKAILFLIGILCLIGVASANVELSGGVMLFWDEPNIPSLYSNVSNETRMSYNATTDIYVMHFPFYQNNSGDTLNFNETVHLKSNNDGSPSYFRWAGNVEFDNYKILGWDTVTNTTAPSTDTTRAYVYCDDNATGNITNGNMSYLGYNSATNTGLTLNYFEGDNVNNNTFLHNRYGILLRNTDNINVNNNTISNYWYGIFLASSDYNTIDNNEMSIGLNGISLESSLYNNITNNDVSDNDYIGIGIDTASDNTIISENYVYDGGSDFGIPAGGIDVDSDDCTIINNHVYGDECSGIDLNGDNANISGNTVYNNGYNGITLNGDNVNISDNTVYSNDLYGIEISSSTDVNLINNNVNNDLGSYYDYNIGSGSTGTIVTDTTKNYDTYRIDTTSDPVTFNNGVDYDISVTETTVIQDGVATGTKAALITVISGTIDQIDISSLSLNTPYHLSYFITGVVIESQTSDGAGNASFTSNLSAESYAISDNLFNFTFSNVTITPSSVRENEPFTVSVNINDTDGTIITARVTINSNVYEMIAGSGDTWSYTFTDTSIPTRYEVEQFNARDNDDAWNSTTSDLYIDVQSSTGTGSGAEPTPEPTPEPTEEPEPEEPAPGVSFPSVRPSNGAYEITIGETHITVPEFFESPLWEIAIFMMGSLIFVGMVVELGGKK